MAVKKQSLKKKTQQPTVWYRRWAVSARARASGYLARRPHRSFRRSHHRDYARSLGLPGYWSFTVYVARILWTHKTTFAWVVIIYALLSGIFVGLASQETYSTLSDALKETGSQVFQGGWGEVSQASLLLLTGITGAWNQTPTDAQQAYGAFFGLMTWLTTVWLLRAFLAGRHPRFRDGLYNSGAAIIPTFLVCVLLVVQLLPASLAVIAFSAAVSSGFLDGGAVTMLFSVAALLLITLSAYWIISTLIALVVVTLPGMYPMQAIRTAGDLVIGRRLRILYRWAWLAFVVASTWAIVMVPVIIFEVWLKGLVPFIGLVPIVPLVLLVASSATIVFSAAYIYLLYRKVVDDDAKPA